MTLYSSPSSFGLARRSCIFWLAERSDLAAPRSSATAAPFLPLPQGWRRSLFNGLELKGEFG